MKYFSFIVSLFACIGLIFPSFAYGQSYVQCGTTYSSTPYYSSSSYIAPTSYPLPALVAVIPAIFVPSASYTVGLSTPIAVSPVVSSVASITTQVASATTSSSDILAEIRAEIRSEFKQLREDNKMYASSQTAVLQEMVNQLKHMNGNKPSTTSNTDTTSKPIIKSATDTSDISKDEVLKSISVLKTNCSQCHSTGVDETKSAGFTMFDKGEIKLCKDGNCDERTSESLAYSMARKITKDRKCPGASTVLVGEDKALVLRTLPAVKP